MSAPRRVRAAGAVLAVLALLGLVLTGPTVGQPATAAPPAANSSEVTVSGHGPFANLRVTVSQTKDLINQTIRVSWSGGVATEPREGGYSINFLQLMQCWGDVATGPDREQCEFGSREGLADSERGGYYVTSRKAVTPLLSDPKETTYLPTPANPTPYVAFRSVTGKVSTTGWVNEFYDSFSSNEQPFGRIRPDGTGEDFFEVLTAREAPGLGCGTSRTESGRRVGRSCWLVIVPRGKVEVDGRTRTPDRVNRLDSSPLSATNWEQRLVVKLEFAPIGGACPIGSAERPTAGQEMVAEAVTRWQPALCAATGRIFGYSQVGDDVARRQLTSDTPALSFVSRPLTPDQVPLTGTPVYAPVALSGVVIAFNVERQTLIAAPPEVKANDGVRMTGLKLTPRLVAKLLTQSYRRDVAVNVSELAHNPADMSADPEFLRLNPAFADPVKLLEPGLSGLLEPIGMADAYRQIWAWVAADPEARAFLAGQPDPDGMVVNSNYRLGLLDLPRSDFPKSDPNCREFDTQPPLCTLDLHPYASDMHDGARSANRGDTLGRSAWDPTAVPPSYKKVAPQSAGVRRMLTITDAATAARYNLPTAQLRNASGDFVGPTPSALLAGLAAMKPGSVPSVREPAARTIGPNAYPLTSLTYATTVPAGLDSAARRDYAGFLRYAVGAGQTPGLAPGQLPPGYAPLPAALQAQTRAAAAEILTAPSTTPGSSPPPGSGGGPDGPGAPAGGAASPGGGQAGAGQSDGGQSGGGKSSGGGPTSRPSSPPATAPVRAGRALPPSSAPVAVAERHLTTDQPVGAIRYALAGVALLGVLASGAGPALLRFATRTGR